MHRIPVAVILCSTRLGELQSSMGVSITTFDGDQADPSMDEKRQ